MKIPLFVWKLLGWFSSTEAQPSQKERRDPSAGREKELIEAFSRIANADWAPTRRGIIVTVQARLRVGSWEYSKHGLVVKAENPIFEKELDKLKRKGLFVVEPGPVPDNTEEDYITVCSISTASRPLEQCGPADLERTLKGYTLMEGNFGPPFPGLKKL